MVGIRLREYVKRRNGDLEEVGINEMRDCINAAPFMFVMTGLTHCIKVEFFEHEEEGE